MKMRLLSMVVLSSLVVMTGCGGGNMGVTKETGGAVLGGAAGGALGSQVGDGKGRTAAIIGGTLLGALLGGAVGRSMDTTDRLQAQRALENSPSGEPVKWYNPDNNAQYEVTPTRTYYRGEQPCREFTTVAVIDGKRETVYGTACRQSDGTWQTQQ